MPRSALSGYRPRRPNDRWWHQQLLGRQCSLHGGALKPPTAVEGVAFTNSTVYRFTDDNTLATASDYSAVVTLGDGNTVTLTSAAGPNGQIVADPNGGFDVQLSYTYREELSNATFGVAVTDQGGQTTGGGTSNFSVADAALHGGALSHPQGSRASHSLP